jgi:hypothetical protein
MGLIYDNPELAPRKKTVAAAKAAGASWGDIGRAVGIGRQSAHERWADKP